MHVAWLQTRGHLDQCPLCLTDVQYIPYEDRMSMWFPIPCQKHGNPAELYYENEAAFDIYAQIYPGDMQIIEMQHGDTVKRELFLRIEPIKIWCDILGEDIQHVVKKLKIIHEAWTK